MPSAPQIAAYAAAGALALVSRGSPREFLLVGLACDLARLGTSAWTSEIGRAVDGWLVLVPCAVFARPHPEAAAGIVGWTGAAILVGETVAAEIGLRDAFYVAAFAAALVSALPWVLARIRDEIERLLILSISFSSLVGAALFAFWSPDWSPINVANVVSTLVLAAACVAHRRQERADRLVGGAHVAPVPPREDREVQAEGRQVDEDREP